jgi:hypothetical protein
MYVCMMVRSPSERVVCGREWKLIKARSNVRGRLDKLALLTTVWDKHLLQRYDEEHTHTTPSSRAFLSVRLAL